MNALLANGSTTVPADDVDLDLRRAFFSTTRTQRSGGMSGMNTIANMNAVWLSEAPDRHSKVVMSVFEVFGSYLLVGRFVQDGKSVVPVLEVASYPLRSIDQVLFRTEGDVVRSTVTFTGNHAALSVPAEFGQRLLAS